MLIYWILLAFPATMALAYPAAMERYRASAAQGLAIISFIIFYTMLAALRFEIGGDWGNYEAKYLDIKTDSLGYALTSTDPLYGLLNWLSALVGGGVYLVNGVCALLLIYGVVRVALRFRDPWLAITMAVPYLLIVVGMGYVRQGAAIGLILVAIASFDQSRPWRTSIFLALAMGFHSTAIVVFPMFAYALSTRHRALSVIFTALGSAAYIFVLAPRLSGFEAGYLDADYDSEGAFVRVLMNVLASAMVLLRWRYFAPGNKARSVWISIGLANFVAFAILLVTPSSTAVDRLALFLAPIQVAMFGEFRNLVPLPGKFAVLLRLLLIAVAVAVQVVWLIYASHAEYWVPYQSVLQFL